MAEKVSDSVTVTCPVCAGDFGPDRINAHLDECLQSGGVHQHHTDTAQHEPSGPPSKKARTNTPDPHPAAAVFSLFQTRPKASESGARDPAETSGPGPRVMETPGGPEGPGASPETSGPGVRVMETPEGPDGPGASSPRALKLNNVKPLAEVLRPSTLEEYFGQNKLLGEQTLLRSLLQSQEIPSLILWGPPGCGKVSGLWFIHSFAPDTSKPYALIGGCELM